MSEPRDEARPGVEREPYSSDAATAVRNGWLPGSLLAGNEGYGETVILVTAVGEACILARAVSHRGEPVDSDEGSWTLTARAWRKVGSIPWPDTPTEPESETP